MLGYARLYHSLYSHTEQLLRHVAQRPQAHGAVGAGGDQAAVAGEAGTAEVGARPLGLFVAVQEPLDVLLSPAPEACEAIRGGCEDVLTVGREDGRVQAAFSAPQDGIGLLLAHLTGMKQGCARLCMLAHLAKPHTKLWQLHRRLRSPRICVGRAEIKAVLSQLPACHPLKCLRTSPPLVTLPLCAAVV